MKVMQASNGTIALWVSESQTIGGRKLKRWVCFAASMELQDMIELGPKGAASWLEKRGLGWTWVDDLAELRPLA